MEAYLAGALEGQDLLRDGPVELLMARNGGQLPAGVRKGQVPSGGPLAAAQYGIYVGSAEEGLVEEEEDEEEVEVGAVPAGKAAAAGAAGLHLPLMEHMQLPMDLNMDMDLLVSDL